MSKMSKSAFAHTPETRIAVLGAGVEGRAVLDYLRLNGCRDVTVCDKDEGIQIPEGVRARLGEDYLAGLDDFDVVYRSPGVPRDLASLLDAERVGVIITSATKEFFRRCPCTIVGITGSNGKTTTTTLIAEMLRPLYGENLHVGGNDRQPLLAHLPSIERDHVVVLELSSFQLEDLGQSPHVAVVLNITPNHLDVHPHFEDYLRAKSHIVRHQTKADRAVLNWAFERIRGLSRLTPARCTFFNQADGPDGAFLREGRMVLRHEGIEEVVMSAEAPRCLTNVDNFLAAITTASLFGVELDVIRQVLSDFPGVAQRLELVRELDGVRYYNDSASTTPESTMNALRSFAEGNVVLLAGGSDKRLEYDALVKEMVRTRTRCLLIGQTRERIGELVQELGRQVRHPVHVELFTSLEQAVHAARRVARPGDAVVLSPGCASFDMFRNSKDRGEQFRKLVLALRQSDGA